MISRLTCAAVVSLAVMTLQASAQTGQSPGVEPKPTENGSRPAAPTPAPSAQRIDSIFEALPTSFTRAVVFGESNLHFVPVATKKGNIVIAWGGIGSGDAVRFGAAMAAAKPVVEIQLYSPGGVLYEGMKIGRMIRSLGLATRITSGSFCVSACNFVFLGGVVRTIEPQGGFGVHMFSDRSAEVLVADLRAMPASVDEFNDRFPKHALKRYDVERWVEDKKHRNPEQTVSEKQFFQQSEIYNVIIDERVRGIQQDSAQTAADIALFLVEMRLSLRFLVEFADQTSYGMRYLSPDALRSFNIVTN